MDEVFHADFHGFVIDSDQGPSFAGKPINMHPKELAVLLLLVQNAGRRLSKEDLISAAWKGAATSDESIARSISVIKAHLRQASPGTESLIKTEYGLGYWFLGQVGKPPSYVNEENFFMLINVSRNVIALKDGEGRWQMSIASAWICTIAEGVETAGQLELLRSEGCDEAQGYYFNQPVSADEIVRFMRKTVE